MFKYFTEIELLELITNQLEENLHLDYKGADSLLKNDGKKREISKDVSAFANSDGGTIIYGIREFDDLSKRHLPERIEPIDRTFISKEWIEQVINSNIQPKIAGLLITPIQITSSINQVVYVVTIPKSNTAHQASDKKYYKRFNFESVAMDDYEVKDIFNRQLKPILKFGFHEINTTFQNDILTIPILLRNLSIKMAKDVKITISLDQHENLDVLGLEHFDNWSELNTGKLIFGSTAELKIYEGLDIQIGRITLKLKNNISELSFTANIYADNMNATENKFKIIIQDNLPFYIY